MKIKTTFITNSSSSTFIIAWPYKINSENDVIKFVPKKYAKTVYQDATDPIPKNHPDALQRIIEEVGNGYIDGFPCHTKIIEEICKRENITKQNLYDNNIWYNQSYREEKIKRNKIAYKKSKEFLDEITEGSYIYILEYGDDNGEYFSQMEHGNIFAKLPHIKISNH